MHLQPVSIDQLNKYYTHPSAILFRFIELKALYQGFKNTNFPKPNLDLGCGDGYISKILFDDHFTFGIDNGEAKDVQTAIDQHLYKKIYLESAAQMSIKSNSINFVFSNSVIEHIPNNQAVLSEVSRILKPQGLFLFTVPSKYFTQYLFLSNLLKRIKLNLLAKKYENYRNQKLNHYHLLDHQEWTKRLRSNKLKVIKHGYYLPKNDIKTWDLMAILIILGSFVLGKNNSQAIINWLFRDRIRNIISHPSIINPDQGGSLFILAQKT